MQNVEFFVPGRLCILGEHSDWAAYYRCKNAEIEKGYAIVAGLNLGVYVCASISERFVYEYAGMKIECLYNEVADKTNTGFFEYVISSASIIISKYKVHGANILCRNMSLPIKKGLASSAVACLTVIRAYNLLYSLGLSLETEMELAYEAEMRIGSKCGRMDQLCAYGSGLRLVCFDGIRASSQRLQVTCPLNFVLVDLDAKKDTRKILADLNSEYPYAHSKRSEVLFDFLGRKNQKFAMEATKAIESNNISWLGYIMVQYQSDFDKCVAPFSSELKAPKLHELMQYLKSTSYALGCKGVGSQGDGMAQILVSDEEAAHFIAQNIKRQFGYTSYYLKL